MLTETERLPFGHIKNIYLHSVYFPMNYHIKHIDLEIKVC